MPPDSESEVAGKLEKARNKRAQKYLSILDSNIEVSSQDRHKRERILGELPDIKDLQKIIKAAYIDHSLNFPRDKDDIEAFVRGFLFEEYVKLEEKIFGITQPLDEEFPGSVRYFEQMKGLVETSHQEEFLAVFHNPKLFDFDEIAHLHNPDISIVDTKSKQPETPAPSVDTLIGVGEAKSSWFLDHRCYLQFCKFYENSRKIIDFLNARDDGKKHGLQHLGMGQNGVTLDIVPQYNFKMYLIVPRDVVYDINNPQEHFKSQGRNPLSQIEMDDFAAMFRDGRITVRNASIGKTELTPLAEFLANEISIEMEIKKREHLLEQRSR